MHNSGRVTAAIEILTTFFGAPTPLKSAITDWGRANRYAGAKDRAWISGLCLDVLRKKNSLGWRMESDEPRSLVLACLHFEWRMSIDAVADLCAEEPHGPGALSENEKGQLASPQDLEAAPASIRSEVPEWFAAFAERAFGNGAAGEGAALATRADIDLRINTLKSSRDKTLSALKSVKGAPAAILDSAARITAPDPAEKAPPVTVIPAFNKGWVEVQDLGSQIASLAAGDIAGKQVLDFCAGGGGKTLALGAMMENTGQLYAYDRDARRLQPIYARAKRAGLRNLQVINPMTEKDALRVLQQKIDIVFVDAPCSGAGTWRRHPDTKWRLSEKQLRRRMEEQDAVLREAAPFVKRGGRMVWVTCSFLMEENEDRLDAFLDQHSEFSRVQALTAMADGNLTKEGRSALEKCVTPTGDLRLTPARIGTDGFFIAVMKRAD